MNNKPYNPYNSGTIPWSLLEDDWSDLTPKEIGEILGCKPSSVNHARRQIKKELGYDVPMILQKSGDAKNNIPTKYKHVECISEKFVERLKSLRKERGISQKVLAELMGMHRNSINLYELGKSLPRKQTVKRICEFFEVSEKWLLGFTDNRY